MILDGNHEKQQRDAIKTHMVAAYKLRAADELDLPPALSVSKLLALHELGIEWRGGYPDEEYWLHDGFQLVLGVQHGGYCPSDAGQCSVQPGLRTCAPGGAGWPDRVQPQRQPGDPGCVSRLHLSHSWPGHESGSQAKPAVAARVRGGPV